MLYKHYLWMISLCFPMMVIVSVLVFDIITTVIVVIVIIIKKNINQYWRPYFHDIRSQNSLDFPYLFQGIVSPLAGWKSTCFPRHRGPQPGRLPRRLVDSQRRVCQRRRAAGLAALRAAGGGLLGHATICGGWGWLGMDGFLCIWWFLYGSYMVDIWFQIWFYI